MVTAARTDHIQLVYQGISDVDDVFRTVSDDVVRIVTNSPPDHRVIMRQVDPVMNRAWGLTQRETLTSDLYRLIVRDMDVAAARPYIRAVERTRTIVERQDPAMWQRAKAQALLKPTAPFSQVMTAFDTFDEFGNRITPRLLAERRQRLARSLDPQRRWVTPDGYRLSDRLWKQGKWVRRKIDQTITDGLRHGISAVDLADQLERFLNPDKAPTTYTRNGKVVRRHQTNKPYGVYGSSYARTLARTEITRVFGAATIESAKVTPGVRGVQWLLSASHPENDECDRIASQDRHGLGKGVYPPDEVPRYPSHPNDICTLSHAMKSRAEVLDDLVKEYGLE
jgi:hypothetical protein